MPPFTNDTIISYFFLHSRTVESVDFSSTDRRVKKILIVVASVNSNLELYRKIPGYRCIIFSSSWDLFVFIMIGIRHGIEGPFFSMVHWHKRKHPLFCPVIIFQSVIQYFSSSIFSSGSYTVDSYTPPLFRIVLLLPSFPLMQVISTLPMPSSLHTGSAVFSICVA